MSPFEHEPGMIPNQFTHDREQQDAIDRERVEMYHEYDPLGPRVGNVEVLDKETNKPKPFDVRVRSQDGYEQFLLCSKETVDAPTMVGRIWLRADVPGKGVFHEESPRPSHDPELQYGETFSTTPQSKEFIVMTQSDGWNHRFRGLGSSLARAAFERSFQNGAEGRVQGQAAFYSFGAWEAWGFRGQPIYDENGEVVHAGDRWHKRLQEARESSARFPSLLPQEEREKFARRSFHLEKEDQAYFYLPDNEIAKERDHIAEHPILDANGATIDALLAKHADLARQYSEVREAEEKLQSFGSQWQESVTDHRGEFGRIADGFTSGGDTKHAREIFEKLLEVYQADLERDRTQPIYAEEDATAIARIYNKMGEPKNAYDYWMQAGGSAEKRDELETALDYYTSAPNPPKVGEMLEKLHGTAYRDW